MKASILFSHGSRDPLWRVTTDAVAQRMRDLEPAITVRCAFLELVQPDLESAVADCVRLGATQIVVTPLFLGMGRHAREDLPKLLDQLRTRYPAVSMHIEKPVGEEPAIIDALARVALA